MLIRSIQSNVNIKNHFLPIIKIGRIFPSFFHFHSPFQFVIACAKLFFVWSYAPPTKAELARDIPGWSPELAAKLMEFGQRRFGLVAEDLEGIVEHPRSISGTRLAVFFRDLGYGKVKVSFRSTGDVDVNRFAKQFGGGGHARASGALVPEPELPPERPIEELLA